MTPKIYRGGEIHIGLVNREESKRQIDSGMSMMAPEDMTPKSVEVELPSISLSKIDDEILADPVRLKEHVTEAAVFGIDAYYRAKAVQDTSYIDKAIMTAMIKFKNDADMIPDEIKQKIIDIVGTDEGQALAPVLNGLNNIHDDIEEKTDTLNQSLNLDSNSSLLSIAFGAVNNMLDPSKDGSIQHTLDGAVAAVAEEDGALANTVKDVIDEVLEDRLEELERICNATDSYIKQKDVVEEVESGTTKKGGPYEEAVHIVAKGWVQMLGGTATHCGGDNQPGDHVLEVPMPTGVDMRIVIESKDESTARGTVWIGKKLSKSMGYRKCENGLWACKTEKGLSSTDIGHWGLGTNELGNWLATTFENITTALTYLRAMEIIRRAKAADIATDLDLKLLMAKCGEIRDKVKAVQDIITAAGQINTNADKIREDAAQLRVKIRDDVAEIESLIKSSK
mgnify:CR=1 FL=1